MGNGWTLAGTSLRVNRTGSWKGRMPSTVPWRFWGGGTLVLGLGCCAAAIGAAAIHAANLRRLRKGFWSTAIPRWFGAGIAYSMPRSRALDRGAGAFACQHLNRA